MNKYYHPLTERENSIINRLDYRKRDGIEKALLKTEPHVRYIILESILNPSEWNSASTCYNAVDGD